MKAAPPPALLQQKCSQTQEEWVCEPIPVASKTMTSQSAVKFSRVLTGACQGRCLDAPILARSPSWMPVEALPTLERRQAPAREWLTSMMRADKVSY